MCSASTIYRSLIESKLQPGEWAVFPGGGGGVGIQGVQLAKAMGIRPIAIDAGAEKKELCMSLGAEAFVDFKESKDVAAEVVKIADGVGAHGVFVTAPSAYNSAIGLVGDRIGAKVMCIGLRMSTSLSACLCATGLANVVTCHIAPAGSTTIGTDPSFFAFKNFTISGTLVGSMKDTARALDYAKRGLLKPIYTVYPIDKLPEAVEKLKRGEIAGRAVVDFNA